MSEVVNVWGGECLGGERLTIVIKDTVTSYFTVHIVHWGETTEVHTLQLLSQ